MVDKDKIKERIGNRGDSASDDTSKSGSNTRDIKSEMSQTDNVEDMETYGEKMDQLKGRSKSGSSQDGVNPSDVGNVLEAIANILFYTEGKMRSYKEPSSKREIVETNITTDIYEQFTEFVAQNNVQNICEKYGIDWENDVLKVVISEQDFSGGEEEAFKTSSNVIDMGGVRGFSKTDFHKLLMTLGYMLMFTKTLEEKYKDGDSPEEKMSIDPIKDISSKCIDFIGTFNILSVSKNNGIHWEKDVIDRIVEG